MDDDPTPEPFRSLESAVRCYCRVFPTVFRQARGCHLIDEQGRQFLDFFSGAGALNYGHNHPLQVARLVDYLQSHGITHSLDMATVAKRNFIERFQRSILAPRRLAYRLQFPGPTGTNAVEAALKLARKVTGRRNVLYCENGYHGVTLGSLSVTANPQKRRAAGVPLGHTMAVPYDGAGDPGSLVAVERQLAASAGGDAHPAALIVETVQAEGGVNVASHAWLGALAELLRRHQVLLIVDDIQVGCGRTGPFFSFEPAGIAPDLVCLSKSLSGLGLPMSLLLVRPDLDVWAPGEHNGTFRGNNLAFVTAAAALDHWQDDVLSREVLRKGERVAARLAEIAARHPEASPRTRGRGLIQALELAPAGLTRRVASAAFRHGLVIETVGRHDQVLKLLPPLVIADADLDQGLRILEDSLAAELAVAAVEGRLAVREP